MTKNLIKIKLNEFYNMKYKILFVLLIIFNPFTISVALSEKIYFSCDNIRMENNTKFKYEKTIIFKNFYEEQNGD